jgi:phosphohistidine phosphatase
MILYIIRHAIAEQAMIAAGPEQDDSQRPLTPKGRSKMRRIALGLKALQPSIDLILTSPYLRAVQTARILAKQFELINDQVILTENLAPSMQAGRLVQEINDNLRGRQTVALVGHEPSLSRLVSLLISGDPRLRIVLKKGGVCRLSAEALRDGQCATLEWLLSPAQLVRIGR